MRPRGAAGDVDAQGSVFKGSHDIAEAVRSASLPLRRLPCIVFVLTFLGSWQRAAHQSPWERGPGGQALSRAPHPLPQQPRRQ